MASCEVQTYAQEGFVGETKQLDIPVAVSCFCIGTLEGLASIRSHVHIITWQLHFHQRSYSNLSTIGSPLRIKHLGALSWLPRSYRGHQHALRKISL